MKSILERVGKERKCPNCSYSLKYSWLSLINKDWVGVYSSDGNTVLVSTELMNFSGEEMLLEKNISDYEKKRSFNQDYNFSVRNEMKCPSCGFALTSRSTENFKDVINGRLIFLDDMTFINDESHYKVRVKIT